ncbi:hypothetical protein SERLA73DRAFT_159863 [Serpula lacrymans var. lacrymans S7.3]|uniref:Proteasome activator complex subunit 4 n=1 Tax=Serpula lacrymans var. lacrymans (strain S7.3) TaxID=936435 RepID=F8PU16_SERL3|nr:hypothetical protein SERLA73DRAFT_159863 [Serpula lacrymans var. lacrymans S7.3]
MDSKWGSSERGLPGWEYLYSEHLRRMKAVVVTYEPVVPEDIDNSSDRYIQKLKEYARSLPYAIESNAKIQAMLDFILLRITQCVEAKDYDPGLIQWDSMLSYWSMLKYPFPKEKRMKLAKLYFHVSTTPGMSTQIVAICADGLSTLTRSKKKLSIEDMRLPWKPIYDILSQDLFLSRRQFEYNQLSWCMGYIADIVRRFFHPAAIDEMLATFVPLINGTDLNSILSSQYYLLTFLPLTHPQSYLPMLSRLWESINSYMYDDRMLHFLSRLAEMHVDPDISDPAKFETIPDDERSEGEGRPKWCRDDLKEDHAWSGLYKDVGIFTEHEWHLIMCKCLASMEIPLADAGSLTTGPSADNSAGFEIGRLPKPSWRITSLARIIVYSMAPDGPVSPASNAPSPLVTPAPSGVSTPQLQGGSVADYLTVPLHKFGHSKGQTYIAGCKALDSLARLIASTEHFFHPTNSGSWTNDLSSFIKYIVYEFNKRWHEEEKPDCKTPKARRLTRLMKRELVKCLRTVVLLAMFSQDSATVTSIQSALKSMSLLEPDLILHPILERAIPSLEALVETHRTLAVIKALGAVAPALVSREVYYPGGKYLIQILQLLIPGIDLNDPSKTLCTTGFLAEISQYIMFKDLTSSEDSKFLDSPEQTPLDTTNGFITYDSSDQIAENELSNEDEDKILKDTTGSFATWLGDLIGRIIQLLENLPEEGVGGTAGGTTEVQVVDAVTGAFNQICVHLSDSLFDLVLKMIYDYASTNVRSNAVRAIHQLVECVANANPEKTLAKFFPFCVQNILTEIDHGASSVRTTSSSTPLPSDATLHWNLAILRGSVYNDGTAVLKYKDQFLHLFKVLQRKTYSKRGYSWSGKLLSSTLVTLTHTYPLENRFVNPDEWNNEEFQNNHHKYWGKLYSPEDVQLSWHVPNNEEIDFALRLFKELTVPTLEKLENLLDIVSRDAEWRNDFCRYLTFVQNAFSGIPTLFKDVISTKDLQSMTETSDVLNEIPEMIASIENLNSGFCLTDPDDERFQFIISLRHRFGQFLHKASISLQQQGEENTVDAVQVLLQSIRTYMLEYGDSRDSYSINGEQYSSDINVARQYAGQKIWPRAVYVRRARHYHSARLHWNSIERSRGALENVLIDDVVEWSMWHYPNVRESSQYILDSLCSIYDGVRIRALPILYKALEPGSDDDRMKGALWTLNMSTFGKFAISEPTLATEYIKCLLECQHNEKPSIQNCVSTVADNSLQSFLEPCFLVYDVENPALDKSLSDLQACLTSTEHDKDITRRAREKRIERVNLMNQAIDATVKTSITDVIDAVNDKQTHWRYAIAAVRVLRTCIRRDVLMRPEHVRIFFDKVHDSNPTMRYVRMVTFLSLKSLTNPLKRRVTMKPSYASTMKVLGKYRSQTQLENSSTEPLWEASSEDVISCVREIVQDSSFWKQLSTHFAEENYEKRILQDNISDVKSIFQLLEDQPFEALKPTLEELLADKDQNKQRAAAELLAGVLNGSKHWSTVKQDTLWEWALPFIKQIVGKDIKTDTLPIWTSFFEYLFYKKDPRRMQPLVDYVFEEFNNADYNGESAFDSVKILSLFRAFYSELGWKFSAWSDDALSRAWPELRSEHDEVRAHVSELLAFSSRIKWQPKPSVPSAEAFVRECRTSDIGDDITGMRGTYHLERVNDLVNKFNVWREERLPGVRAFQSTYDRVGIAVCKWFFQSVHDTQAISTYDYILPLMPELFRFSEVNDNDELARRANLLLIRMCGVTPPQSMIGPLLETIFDAMRKSPSWKVRLKALPILQVFYFRQLPLISELKVVEILDMLCKCLDDEVVEVREMVGTTLSGILRLSPRRSVITLKDRFVKLAKKSHIPEQRNTIPYALAIRQRHAAIIGICALIDSFPYTIEKWMPELLTSVLVEHTFDPIPISTTVHKCASNFRKTHQDTWHEDCRRFNDDQLAALSTLLTGSSYYKDTGRVIAGLKAAIHNPNVSEEAKDNAIQRLNELGDDTERGGAAYGRANQQGSTRVLGGYKATLSNENTSEEAKQHAQEVLEAAGVYERPTGISEEEHETRVLAGYKAALNNPRVSEAAKTHARDFLEQHGAL